MKEETKKEIENLIKAIESKQSAIEGLSMSIEIEKKHLEQLLKGN